MTMAGICKACGNTLPYHRKGCALSDNPAPRSKPQWREVTAERYDEMLGVLPPATMRGPGFLVGEPNSHRRCDVTGDIRADYAAFVQHGGRYFEGPNMTLPEWRALNVHDVLSCATPLDAMP